MADVKVESNASAVAADLRAAAQRTVDVLAAEVAEVQAAFLEELRGPQAALGSRPSPPDPDDPGFRGVTPFATGNLLLSGNTRLDRLRFTFVNDAPQRRIRGGKVEIDHGGESYASYAHRRGGAKGDYKRDAEALFNRNFGEDLESRAEAALMAVLDVG